MSLGKLTPSQSLGEGLQVTNFDQSLHIAMVIGKCTVIFRRTFCLGEGLRRGEYVWGTFHRGICHGEENFHEWNAGFTSIILKKSMKK